ncbi:unnamed protein product, partial [Arctogadus glacialis]
RYIEKPRVPHKCVVPSSTVPPSASIVPTSPVPPSTSIVPTCPVPPSTSTVPTSTVPPSTSTVPTSTVPPSTSTVPTSTVPPSTSTVPTSTVPPSTSTVRLSTVPPSNSTVPTSTVPPSTSTVRPSTVPPSTSTVPSFKKNSEVVIAVIESPEKTDKFILRQSEFNSLAPHKLLLGETIECYLRAMLNVKGQFFRMRQNRYQKTDWVDVKWQQATIKHSIQKDGCNCGVFVMKENPTGQKGNTKWVECTKCKRWYHPTCMAMSDEEWEKEEVALKWNCGLC